MKYFITGGSGFRCKPVSKLIERGDQVTVFDDLQEVIKKKDFDKINFIKGDVRKNKQILNNSRSHNYFIHLAAINGTENFYTNPQSVIDVSVEEYSMLLKHVKSIKYQTLFWPQAQVYQSQNISDKENVELVIPDVHNPRFPTEVEK